MSMYGSAGGSAYAPAPAPPRVRFEIIGEAWGLFQQQMGTWALSVLVVFVLNFAVSFALRLLAESTGLSTSGVDGHPKISLPSLSFRLVSLLITNTLSHFLLAGLYKMALKQLRGMAISIGDVFSAGRVFVPLFFANLLYGACVLGGLLLFIIPGFVVACLLVLSTLVIVDERETSPAAALKASGNALKTDALSAVLFVFVVGFVAAIGFLGCGVGILFTYPLLPLSYALLYQDFFGEEGAEAAESPETGRLGPQNPWASPPPAGS